MLSAGRPVLVGRISLSSSLSESMGRGSGGRVSGAGELLAWDRVEARAEWDLTAVAGGPVVEMCFRFKWVWGLVDRMPDREAVICPSAVAGLCGWLRLNIFAVSDG